MSPRDIHSRRVDLNASIIACRPEAPIDVGASGPFLQAPCEWRGREATAKHLKLQQSINIPTAADNGMGGN